MPERKKKAARKGGEEEGEGQMKYYQPPYSREDVLKKVPVYDVDTTVPNDPKDPKPLVIKERADGVVTRENAFIPKPEKSIFPCQQLFAFSVDVMGTPDEVFHYFNMDDDSTFCTDLWTFSDEKATFPRPKKAGNHLGQPNPSVPMDKNSVWYPVQWFKRKFIVYCSHYTTTHASEKDLFFREHCVCPFNIDLTDVTMFGPASNGRKDMTSLRFAATMFYPLHLAILFGPFMKGPFQRKIQVYQRNYHEWAAANYALKHPDAEVPFYDGPEPLSYKVIVYDIFCHYLGLTWVFAFLTNLLSWLLTALFSSALPACLLTPCAVRAMILVPLAAYIFFVDYYPIRYGKYKGGLDFTNRDFENAFQDYSAKRGWVYEDKCVLDYLKVTPTFYNPKNKHVIATNHPFQADKLESAKKA